VSQIANCATPAILASRLDFAMSDRVEITRAVVKLAIGIFTADAAASVLRQVATSSADVLVGQLHEKKLSDTLKPAIGRFAKAASHEVLDFANSIYDQRTRGATNSAAQDFLELIQSAPITLSEIFQSNGDIDMLTASVMSRFPPGPTPSERRLHVRQQLVRLFLLRLLDFVASTDEFRQHYMMQSLQHLADLRRSVAELNDRIALLEARLGRLES
jgi:hypothetical protein